MPQSSPGCEDTSENHHILSTSIILFSVVGILLLEDGDGLPVYHTILVLSLDHALLLA